MNQINPQAAGQIQDGGTFTWPLSSMPANFNYNEIDGTDCGRPLQSCASLMPTHVRRRRDRDAHWNRDYLASEPKADDRPQQVVTYRDQPEGQSGPTARRSRGRISTGSGRRSTARTRRIRLPRRNGYEDIESVERGKDDREVDRHVQRTVRRLAGVFCPLYPASTNKDPKIFNEGWKDRPLRRPGRSSSSSIDQTAKTITLVRNEKWWGDPAKLDSIVFRAIDARRADRRARQRRDRRHGRRAGRQHVQPRQGDRRRGDPRGRRAELPPRDDQRRRARTCRTCACAGRSRWRSTGRRSRARCSARWASNPQPLNNHIFMPNQHGYQDNSGDVGTYDPEARGGDCSTRPAGSSTAASARRTAAARDQLRHSRGRRDVAAGIRADAEHARPRSA